MHRETTRLAAKIAMNTPIAQAEQNFLLLPNLANVMSPISMAFQKEGDLRPA